MPSLPLRLFFLRVLPFCMAGVPLSCVALEPVRVVATGGRIASSFYAPAAPSTSFWHRTPHKLGGPVSEMKIGFIDWVHTTSAESSNTVNDVTIGHAWVERASTGQVLPLTFSGRRELVLPANSTTAYWLSDPVASSAWTGAAPARDEVFWVNVKGSIPSGGRIPVGTPATYPGARFFVYDPANEPDPKVDFAGVQPAISGSGSRVSGLPLLFLGRFTVPGHLAVIGIGDSNLDGTGDNVNPVKVISGYGFFNRAALDEKGANAIAMFNLSRHGESAGVWVGKHERQIQFLRFANVIVEEFGTNDLNSNGTGDPATILKRLEAIWTLARGEGVQKIVRTNLLPRTRSDPDGWMSVEAQTPNTGWGADGKRDAINAGLTAALAAKKIDALADTLAAVAHPGDDHYWAINGSKDYLTIDGTHPSPKGYELLAAPLREALLSLKVDESRR